MVKAERYFPVRDTSNMRFSEFFTPYNVKLTGIIDLGNGQYINVYLNPEKNNQPINWNINGTTMHNADAADLQGKKWISIKNVLDDASIDVSKLTAGIYFIKITVTFR